MRMDHCSEVIMFTRRSSFLPVLVLVVSASGLYAKSDAVNHDRKGVAIRGYDPVAYFTDSKPVKGDPQFSYSWQGATWVFASAQHRDMFAQHPDQYQPQYGGYCAYGVGQGHTVDIDPEAWRIIEGKLYLNYDKSVQQMFLKEPQERIKLADKNWPGLHN